MGISLSQRVVLFGCILKLHIHEHGHLKNCRIVYRNDSNVVNRDLEFMGISGIKKWVNSNKALTIVLSILRTQ